MSNIKNLEDRLTRIEDKVDKLADKLDQKLDRVEQRIDHIDTTMAKNTASLEEHMRRTELLEKANEEMKPIKNVYTVAWGIAKIASAVGFTLGMIAAALKILGIHP